MCYKNIFILASAEIGLKTDNLYVAMYFMYSMFVFNDVSALIKRGYQSKEGQALQNYNLLMLEV